MARTEKSQEESFEIKTGDRLGAFLLTNRKAFQKKNRRMRRRFTRRTEALLKKCPKKILAEEIKRDKRGRENMNKAEAISEEALYFAEFTEFMGSYYNQDQAEIQLNPFASPRGCKEKFRKA